MATSATMTRPRRPELPGVHDRRVELADDRLEPAGDCSARRGAAGVEHGLGRLRPRRPTLAEAEPAGEQLEEALRVVEVVRAGGAVPGAAARRRRRARTPAATTRAARRRSRA